MVDKQEVRDFWTAHPLGSYEIKEGMDRASFFEQLDQLRQDTSRFVEGYYRFAENRGKKVLDVGCGPGWIVYQYAKAGARICALDLTFPAVSLARRNLARDRLDGRFIVGDAERLPLTDASFDFVCCAGVLHHTPDMARGLAEIYRVLRPGGRAGLAFYYESIFLRPPFFFFTKLLMMVLGVRMHGGRRIDLSLSQEEFGRLYDGVDNPLGKILSRKGCDQMLQKSGFSILRSQVYYFPKRFFPLLKHLPIGIYRLADRIFGSMIFYEVLK